MEISFTVLLRPESWQGADSRALHDRGAGGISQAVPLSPASGSGAKFDTLRRQAKPRKCTKLGVKICSPGILLQAERRRGPCLAAAWGMVQTDCEFQVLTVPRTVGARMPWHGGRSRLRARSMSQRSTAGLGMERGKPIISSVRKNRTAAQDPHSYLDTNLSLCMHPDGGSMLNCDRRIFFFYSPRDRTINENNE